MWREVEVERVGIGRQEPGPERFRISPGLNLARSDAYASPVSELVG
jgi:hypothetical protein